MRTLSLLLTTLCCMHLSGQIKVDNDIFSLDMIMINWEVMSEVELLERMDYVKAKSGRTVNYVAGLRHRDGIPYVMFQNRAFDMSGITPMINFKALVANSSGPAFIDSINTNLPAPTVSEEKHYSVKGRYGISRYELAQNDIACYNYSYIFLHEGGHLLMQSISPQEYDETSFRFFERIRQNIRIKKELPFVRAANSEKKKKKPEGNATSTGTNSTLVWIAVGILMLVIVGWLLRKKGGREV